MNGAVIAEYGLKALLWLIDAGFALAFIVFLYGGIKYVHDANGREKEETAGVGCILVAVLCGIIAVILFGLAIMPWWA